MDKNSELMPELQDILNRIQAFNITHKEGCFVYNFIGFKKEVDTYCEDCGGECDEIDDKKSQIGAYGNLETVRSLINMLRDLIEDEVDEEGFVNT